MIHILLAEDNVGDAILVEQALQENCLSCQLHVVKDGAKALEFVAQMGRPGYPPYPDIVLLDLNLPKATGTQILSKLRENPECAHIPVIVLTSSDSPKDRESVEKLGIARYFRKPLSLDLFLQLGAVVSEVLDESSRSSAERQEKLKG